MNPLKRVLRALLAVSAVRPAQKCPLLALPAQLRPASKVVGACDEVAGVGAGRVVIVRSDLWVPLVRFAGVLWAEVSK